LDDFGREAGRHAHVGVSGGGFMAEGYLLLHGGRLFGLLMRRMPGLVFRGSWEENRSTTVLSFGTATLVFVRAKSPRAVRINLRRLERILLSRG
jgi:hypothetical protein